MPTIEVYAHGHSLTFRPSERAERIVLEEPAWWDHRIDYARDRAVARDGSHRLEAVYVLNSCRQVVSEKPPERWARKEVP